MPFAPVDEAPDVFVRGRVLRGGRHRVVDLFLVNDQEQPERNRDEAWLFQAKLAVSGVDGECRCSSGARRRSEHAGHAGRGGALARAALPQPGRVRGRPRRRRPRRGVAETTRDARCGSRRTARPRFEVARVDAPVLPDVELDMKILAGLVEHRARRAAHPAGRPVRRVARRRGAADRGSRRRASGRWRTRRGSASSAPAGRRAACAQGIELLGVGRAGRRGVPVREPGDVAAARPHRGRRRCAAATSRCRIDDAVAQADEPENRSWRPFQLAFVLLNLPALADPTHAGAAPTPGSSTCSSSRPAAARPRRTSA